MTIRRRLLEKIRKDKTITYSQLMQSLPSRDRETGREVLGELAEEYADIPRPRAA